jgi:hypothetical protein
MMEYWNHGRMEEWNNGMMEKWEKLRGSHRCLSRES